MPVDLFRCTGLGPALPFPPPWCRRSSSPLPRAPRLRGTGYLGGCRPVSTARLHPCRPPRQWLIPPKECCPKRLTRQTAPYGEQLDRRLESGFAHDMLGLCLVRAKGEAQSITHSRAHFCISKKKQFHLLINDLFIYPFLPENSPMAASPNNLCFHLTHV